MHWHIFSNPVPLNKFWEKTAEMLKTQALPSSCSDYTSHSLTLVRLSFPGSSVFARSEGVPPGAAGDAAATADSSTAARGVTDGVGFAEEISPPSLSAASSAAAYKT